MYNEVPVLVCERFVKSFSSKFSTLYCLSYFSFGLPLRFQRTLFFCNYSWAEHNTELRWLFAEWRTALFLCQSAAFRLLTWWCTFRNSVNNYFPFLLILLSNHLIDLRCWPTPACLEGSPRLAVLINFGFSYLLHSNNERERWLTPSPANRQRGSRKGLGVELFEGKENTEISLSSSKASCKSPRASPSAEPKRC